MADRSVLIGGLFVILIVGSVGGYYFYLSSSSPTGTTISGNEVNISYGQWTHTRNTAIANFDFWELDSTVVLLYDRDSSSRISATLALPDIAIGKMKLRMKTLSTEYNGQMRIDFKNSITVIFSIIRNSNGGYDFRVNTTLFSLGDHNLGISNFYVEWNFDTRFVKISTTRQNGFSHTIYMYTLIESINKVEISTTSSTFNSGTLFYLEDSYLTWSELE